MLANERQWASNYYSVAIDDLDFALFSRAITLRYRPETTPVTRPITHDMNYEKIRSAHHRQLSKQDPRRNRVYRDRSRFRPGQGPDSTLSGREKTYSHWARIANLGRAVERLNAVPLPLTSLYYRSHFCTTQCKVINDLYVPQYRFKTALRWSSRRNMSKKWFGGYF